MGSPLSDCSSHREENEKRSRCLSFRHQSCPRSHGECDRWWDHQSSMDPARRFGTAVRWVQEVVGEIQVSYQRDLAKLESTLLRRRGTRSLARVIERQATKKMSSRMRVRASF